MRKKFLFTLCAILVLNIFPLLFKPALILNFKTFILLISAAVLWLSQPGFSKQDMNSNKQSDKLSILLILIASSVSVCSSVVEWAYFTPDKSQINSVTVIGFIFLLIGICFRVWSINVLGKNFTATVKITREHELIKTGPYKFIRHPSYLGAFVAIIGCPVFLNNTYTIFISCIAMMVAYYFRINVEEKTLSNHFGKYYEDYKKDTYRLLPLIW
jgi:protein-S-isoprenylcysteine O-methyltransferase Ste14